MWQIFEICYIRWTEFCCRLTALCSELRRDSFNVVYSTYKK